MAQKESIKGFSRDEWLAARRTGIGGSEAGAIMGASKYASPFSIYADKIGSAPEKPDNEAMRIGRDLEDYVAKRFTEESSYKVRKRTVMFRSADYPWMLANIDREIIGSGEFCGLECKTTTVRNPIDFHAGQIDMSHWWQCQHYMAVTGASKWFLAVLVMGEGFYWHMLPRDNSAIERLIEAESDLWNNHIVPQIPPQTSGAENEIDCIRHMYPEEIEGTNKQLNGLQGAFDRLDSLKAQIKALEGLKEAEENSIKLAIGEAEKASCGRWRATYKTQSRSSVDKALQMALPDVWNRYVKVSTSRVLRIREVAE